jgi:LmbE family N-acetylglucosaminyl deacetylase
LGFAGIIYKAVKAGNPIKVVIVTNGDGYLDAAYFWKNGCPKGETDCFGSELSKEDTESFGNVRMAESKKALAILGLQEQYIYFLGYPDGKLKEMNKSPEKIVQGNTNRNRTLSNPGKRFSGNNLKEDIESILRSNQGATLYTMHPRDHHSDHSAISRIIQLVRQQLKSENLFYETYWGIVHDPDTDNDREWPLPGCTWEQTRGEVYQKRELRYKPDEILSAPASITKEPVVYPIPEVLWSPGLNHPPLLRTAIDSFRTQTGKIRSDGSKPLTGYEGWIDWNGYLLSFIKRNHLLWKAPLPEKYLP